MMLVREMIPGDLKKFSVGLSSEKRPVEAFANFDPARAKPADLCLLLGGMHGDERATRLLLDSFLADSGTTRPFLAIPLVNPDGWERNTRYTSTGVDLNRNFAADWSSASEEPSGPAPLSEPESRILHDLILEFRPAKIVSLHWALAELDADGIQSTPLARAMWHCLSPALQKPYRLRVAEDGLAESTDAFCPGSLGRWCGHHLSYPDGSRPMIVTLELPYDPELPRPDPLPADHLETLRSDWNKDSGRYLRTAAPAVHRMLAAACTFVPA